LKPIKIFSASWHVPHHHALFGIPNTKWYLLINNVKRWNWFSRPLPDNVEFVPYYKKNTYSIAQLDVDQQCIDPRIGKGQLYRKLNEEVQDIPKIVINHGTPFWPENWEGGHPKRWKMPLGFDTDLKKVLEWQKKFLIEGGKVQVSGEEMEVEGMEKLIGRNKMVVNSFEARKQWGWGKVIWHGLDPNEWWDLPKEPRSVSMISTGGLDYYYGRDFLNSTMSRLREDFGLKHVWISHPGSWTIYESNVLAKSGGWDAYRDFLGRSMIFFNPTRESPMPRSRTEAMLSGCCILTTAYQDASKFVNFDVREIWTQSEGIKEFTDVIDKYIDEPSINGFIIPENPLAVASLINYLIYTRPDAAVRIGEEGRKTAIKIFDKKRFDDEWTGLLNNTIKKWKEKKC